MTNSSDLPDRDSTISNLKQSLFQPASTILTELLALSYTI